MTRTENQQAEKNSLLSFGKVVVTNLDNIKLSDIPSLVELAHYTGDTMTATVNYPNNDIELRDNRTGKEIRIDKGWWSCSYYDCAR